MAMSISKAARLNLMGKGGQHGRNGNDRQSVQRNVA